jgi:hypothetical protein
MTPSGSDVCGTYENKLIIFINKMNYEKFRIESFKRWPIPYINVREMAANGFYYKGESDLVKCNFCDIQLGNWEAEDVPIEQHRKYAPYCPHLNGGSTRNVPLVIKRTCILE